MGEWDGRRLRRTIKGGPNPLVTASSTSPALFFFTFFLFFQQLLGIIDDDRVPWSLGPHVLSTADQCYLVLGLFRPLKSAQLLIHYA